MTLDTKYLERLRDGSNLSESEAVEAFEAILASSDVDLIRSFLAAWAEKGVAAAELAACARILRKNAFRVPFGRPQDLLDIVGTGGSRSKLFNISTAAAFVAAGAGVPVAKHGNKAATSNTGSADALSQLGVNITSDPETASNILNEIGICFMFAPRFHNLKPELASARRSLGHPTLFNLLGPLANPAGAGFQLTGIWDKRHLEPMSEAVADLGTARTWIVYGENGLDEIEIAGVTHVAEITGSKIDYFELTPMDFGIKTASLNSIPGLTPEISAETIKSVLGATNPESPETAIVILNAAAAIYLTGRAATLTEAAEIARESIESGAAGEKLNELAIRTHGG